MRVRETVWSGDRGEGSVFYRIDAAGQRISPSLYLSYRARGKEQVVSAKTGDLADAKRELKRLTRNRENARTGIEPLRTPKAERLTVGELLDANLERAKSAKLASVSQIGYRTETLRALLGSVKAVEFRPEHVDQYKDRRRKGEGTAKKVKVSEATIRRELEVLGAAFGYAKRRGALAFSPFVEKPAVDNVSKLEFPPQRVGELLERLGERDQAVCDLVEFISLTARRPEGLRLLTWSQFDSKAWTLTIAPEKKGNAVMIGLSGSLRRIIERRVRARRPGCDLIFHRDGRHMRAERDREIFAAVCLEMGLPYGRNGAFTIYTVKSTAIGRMNDAGLSDAEIMDRSGHRTDAMMRRYLKQRPERAHASSAKLEVYLQQQAAAADKAGSDADKIANFPTNSRV